VVVPEQTTFVSLGVPVAVQLASAASGDSIEAASVSAKTPDADESWNDKERRRPERLLSRWPTGRPAGLRDILSVMIDTPLNMITYQAREEFL
jgi:hypothetical protein